MSPSTPSISQEEDAVDSVTTGTGDTKRRWNGRRFAQSLAVAITIVCAIALLYPVLASPITADDRYWYLWTTASTDGSFVGVLQSSWERLGWRVDVGRVNLITEVERRLAALGIMKVAVATSTPVPVYQALLKLGLLGGGVLTVLAFLRSLRWRASDGSLVRVSRRSLHLVGMAVTLAVAVGAQSHVTASRNAWTAYPVSTYGAVVVIFGSIALVLWLARLMVERSRVTVIIAAVVLAVLAASTALRYEIVFPAVPIAAVALMIVPVTDRAQRAAGRRAKLVTGLVYVGAFTAVFVPTRLYLASACADEYCYSGVQVELGTAVVRTAFFNVVSAIPGTGSNDILAELDEVGWADRYPVPPTWWSVLTGLLAVAALTMTWWAAREHEPVGAGAEGPTTRQPVPQLAEARLLGVGGGLALLVALGTATVMGLSSRSHEVITEPGEAYRNTVVTWVGLVTCLVLVVVALGLVLQRRGALMTWTALAIAIGTIAALMLPGNLMTLRATRITHEVTDAINWEVVKGDTAQSGEDRRCELYRRIDHEVVTYARDPLKEYSNTTFEIYHGQPFCSEVERAGGQG